MNCQTELINKIKNNRNKFDYLLDSTLNRMFDESKANPGKRIVFHTIEEQTTPMKADGKCLRIDDL